MKARAILIVGIITAIAFTAYGALLLVASWPIEDWTIQSASLFGDSFGVMNSFFTGGAFLLILWTIVLQQEELRLQRKEMSRMVAAHQHELHMNLLNYAFDDENLAKVWADDFDSLLEMRQNMYVNLIISQWLMSFKEGIFNKAIIENNLNRHMDRSEYFRRYWLNLSKFDRSIYDDSKILEFYEIGDTAYQAAMAKQKGTT